MALKILEDFRCLSLRQGPFFGGISGVWGTPGRFKAVSIVVPTGPCFALTDIRLFNFFSSEAL
jgi:hypothetical protein